jgi:hypothetical protein
MNIKELFERIDMELNGGEVEGDFQLADDKILWSYNSESFINEIETFEDDLLNFQFGSIEENLNTAYLNALNKLEEFLDDIETKPRISDPNIKDNIIHFDITE